MGLVLSLACMALNAFLIEKHREKTPRTHFILAIISLAWTRFALAAAALATDGYNKTCGHFVSSGAPCDYVFHQGFWENNDKVLYRKSGPTVKAALAFGWISVITFGLYGHAEYKNWRKSLARV
jgi:hypothetical protein